MAHWPRPRGARRGAGGTRSAAVRHKPGQPFFTGQCPVFDYAHSATQNRLFDELCKKASQLKRAQLGVPLGILLCDGESGLLQAKKSWQSHSTDEILARFLADNPEICFVATFTLRYDKSCPGPSHYRVRVQAYPNPKCAALAKGVVPFFGVIEKQVPPPRHSLTNARLRLEEGEPKYRHYYFGGMTMSGQSIRMSARTLLEILAGRMPVEQFVQRYTLDQRKIASPFMHKLQNGQLITGVTFHHLQDE